MHWKIDTSTFICCLHLGKESGPQKNLKKKIRGRKGRTFFFFEKQVLFTLGLGLTTPYSLGILDWNFYRTFVIVSTEFWLKFEPQNPPTRLAINFLFITFMAERMVRLCVKLFDFFPRWVLIRLTWNCRVLSMDILTWDFRKKLFREIFSEILCKPRLYLVPKLVKFHPSFWNFILPPYWVEKIHKDTLIYYLHPGNEAAPLTNYKKTIRERKARTFSFRKTISFTLGLGLTTPYSLSILVWTFYRTFAILSNEFWLRFKPQIRPTRFAINFLIITTRAERKVRLCVKLFDFYCKWILIRLT